MKPVVIKSIRSREILASGAYPTVETTVELRGGATGTASVPYGASAGSHEATILLDGDKKRYAGRGCLKAVRNVEKKIFPKLRGIKLKSQRALDDLLHHLDPTPRKTKLGGNAILSVSLAFARAAAAHNKQELYDYIAEQMGAGKHRFRRKPRALPVRSYALPRPMMVVIEGGRHADNSTDFQEYCICPLRAIKYKESVRVGIEVYHSIQKVLKKKGYSTNVGNEGAFAPAGIRSNEEPIKIIVEAIKKAGYKPGVDVGIALDPASSEFYRRRKVKPYILSCESKALTPKEMIEYYARLIKKYPIISIEDGLAESDWKHWAEMYKHMGKEILMVGDDLTVTQEKFLQKAIDNNVMNAILIKPNQAGTLTETLDTIALAHEAGMETVVSHRGGGDTNDHFLMDLGVAARSLFTKVGPSRGERVVKYNRMLDIATAMKR